MSNTFDIDLSGFETEASGRKPCVVKINREGDEITFPDPQDFSWKQAESFMAGSAADNPFDFLRTWLSEEDYAKLEDSDPSVPFVQKLIEQVNTYFEGVVGSQGN